MANHQGLTLPAFQQSLCEKIRTVTAKMDQGKGLESAKRDIYLCKQVSEIIQEKSIKSRTELLALALLQKNEGNTDLAEFIMNRHRQVVAKLLKTRWDMFNAQARLERSRKTRLELLVEAAEGECVEGCEGKWLQ